MFFILFSCIFTSNFYSFSLFYLEEYSCLHEFVYEFDHKVTFMFPVLFFSLVILIQNAYSVTLGIVASDQIFDCVFSAVFFELAKSQSDFKDTSVILR